MRETFPLDGRDQRWAVLTFIRSQHIVRKHLSYRDDKARR